ncbi:MAG: MBL fold metallo-hydrolase, partial [Gemmatimonadota bacterium]|nr:MBL fold metallo-hydrolase [Gemmatimonadota bacterium]
RLILVDTGYGDKMTDRDRGIYGMSGSTILGSLSARGVSAEDIDLVILSHLHFDHTGGATRMDEEGRAVPAFPNAQYVVQKGEWEDALNDYGTMKTTYRPENYEPLMDRGVLTLVEGDVEIEEGIHVEVTGGHTRYHQLVKVDSGATRAVYSGDILPMTTHLRAPYNMAYDLFPYDTMVAKMRLLRQAADEGWIIALDHDANVSSGRISCEGEDRYAIEPVVLDQQSA